MSDTNTDNVEEFPGETKVTLPVETVLDGAKKGIPDECLVLGWTDDGKLYIAGTHSNLNSALMLIETAKFFVMHEVAGQAFNVKP